MSKKRRVWLPGRVTVEDEVFEVTMDKKCYRVTPRGRRRVKDRETLEKVAAELQLVSDRRRAQEKAWEQHAAAQKAAAAAAQKIREGR